MTDSLEVAPLAGGLLTGALVADRLATGRPVGPRAGEPPAG
ncbi:hypothetical protein [Tomitella gaofuii]|nr:hypothetical protein [Tomitella gaofuii]